jgi:hypothetical protein
MKAWPGKAFMTMGGTQRPRPMRPVESRRPFRLAGGPGRSRRSCAHDFVIVDHPAVREGQAAQNGRWWESRPKIGTPHLRHNHAMLGTRRRDKWRAGPLDRCAAGDSDPERPMASRSRCQPGGPAHHRPAHQKHDPLRSPPVTALTAPPQPQAAPRGQSWRARPTPTHPIRNAANSQRRRPERADAFA